MTLREWIKENGLRHDYVAKKLGINKGWLSKILSNPEAASRSLNASIRQLTNGEVDITLKG